MLALENAIISFFAVLVLLFCALIPTAVITFALSFILGNTPTLYLAVGIAFYTSVFFTIKIFKPESLQWNKAPRSPLFNRTIYILLGMMVIMFFIGANFPHLLPKPPTLPQNLTGRILFIAMVIFFAPLVEEVFFRGYLVTLLRDPFGKWVTIIITSILFGFSHGFNPIKFAHTFVMGVCFGLLREESNSLRPSILLHFMNNAIASLLIILGWIYT